MGVYVTTAGRGRLWATVLAALVGLALLTTLLVLLPLAALTMLVGMALSGAALLAQRAAAPRAARPGRARPAGANEAAGPMFQLVDADGVAIAARAVSLAGPSEHTLALTRDGYVLVDDTGRVLHRL
jgi:hypothetical protein